MEHLTTTTAIATTTQCIKQQKFALMAEPGNEFIKGFVESLKDYEKGGGEKCVSISTTSDIIDNTNKRTIGYKTISLRNKCLETATNQATEIWLQPIWK